ncbi:hypothetical protein AB5I41_24605 [Sphingomonas sp. MMS24-JH45]
MGPQSACATFGVEADYLARLTWVMVGGAVVIAIGVALLSLRHHARENAISLGGGMRRRPVGGRRAAGPWCC